MKIDFRYLDLKFRELKYLYILMMFLLPFSNSMACSAYYFSSSHKILANNFDWFSGHGVILKNLKNQTKYAYGFRGNNTANWTSKYGSITFNQVGKEFPYSGMNETGLVVTQLWFSQSIYDDNGSPEISELEWIQFQLDNFQSIDEVIANLNHLNIKPISTVHYFLADASGNSAVIEYIEGKAVIHKNTSQSQVITNESIENSQTYFNSHSEIEVDSRTHFDRFCLLKNNLNSYENLNPIQAFDLLDLVSVNSNNYKTYWQLVYNLNQKEILVRTFTNTNIKTIRLSDFQFDENVEYSELNTDAFSFENYNAEINRQILDKTLKMMNIELNSELANEHQMNPNHKDVDSIYASHYTDLIINFVTKNPKGEIYYSCIDNADNFNSKNYPSSFKIGIIPINSKNTKWVIYNFPKTEFALACYQDLNHDSNIESNFFGIPKYTGFSNNKKKLFGRPPNFENASVDSNVINEIEVKIN